MSDDCLMDYGQASGYLLAVALVWLSSILTLATAWSKTPIEQLGLHPKGKHLGEWLQNSSTGIRGYDAIQGTISPMLRIQCHGVALLVFWSLLNLVFGNAEVEDAVCHTQGIPQGVWTTGSYAVVVYVVVCMISSWCMDGVSMPGGPRVFKLGRTPQWENVTVQASEHSEGWRCETAQEAHETTHQQFDLTLTGEPAGRQIWTCRDEENLPQKLWKSLTTDQSQIQEMAQGGRPDFGFNPSKNPNSCDMLFRKQQIEKYVSKGGKLPSKEPAKTVKESCQKAAHFYSMLQCEDGHWAADYGGPHFLMPGLVIAWYVMGKPTNFLNEQQIKLLIKYITSHQQSDGGWGTHIESPSTMFGSTLMYVALRLLGRPADDPACVKGCEFLKEHGGALYTSSWSKFYLCLLGCMDWKGHNSVPPEMWLLPNWFPFHPGRMWCHARMVYLPMGYLYGNRFVYPQAESDPLIQELRQELYCQDYSKIDWIPTRHWVASTDNYSPIPWVMKTLQNLLARYENWSIFAPLRDYVRQKGLQFSLEYIRAEDLQTNYIDIGPVNKVLNLISHFHATGGDLKDPRIVNHLMRIPDYLWVAEDGMKMQGYNGSQCWDTSFCAQALFEAGLVDTFPETSTKIWSYLERTQILSTEVSQASPAFEFEGNEYRQQFYRHISQGGWPFSTSAHGWPISDCTGEGLKASLCLYKSECVQKGLKEGNLRPISDERLFQAANILLTYQNEDGGWATYENNRGWGWYEQLNPSEVFGDIMIDYSYVECSMASLTALVDFQERFPDHRKEDIQHAIDKGRDFLKGIQRDDGSWYGSWACCFTYGIWFGVEGLVKCGEPLDSPCIVDACKFLLKHQRPNGGWGEDFTSCYDKDYAKEGMKAYGDDGSGIINTAWALLALSMAKCP
eukprot:CAMPEP_0176013960 /NCGR_PEP_ID=MMETSP0120_2-20121206/6575_1 /TAXON_ID=160619 /ORGANISM="Kryptoperidinium foliaceum, Strain CCMP 1326" /LENGTH=900 /DNA_ID=CAMNT_0017346883 /DNA_START=17 /DNA_END=2715 /DNA_ORIENTATION=+